MIKEAIDKIIQLKNPEKLEVNKETWVKDGYQMALPNRAMSIKLNSLTGLVDYIEDNVDKHDLNAIMVHIVDQNEVRLVSRIQDIYRTREKFATATYVPASPYAQYNDYMAIEDFKIWLLTDFQENDDRQAILRLVGNLTDQQVKTSTDDGISQAVSSRVGIAKVETAMVPNPVRLIPFRTFTEALQPLSNFVLRLRSGVREDELPRAALFEADGGSWKNLAMLNIKKWLKAELPAGVTILA